MRLDRRYTAPIYRAHGGCRWTQGVVDEIIHVMTSNAALGITQVHVVSLGDNNMRRVTNNATPSNQVINSIFIKASPDTNSFI